MKCLSLWQPWASLMGHGKRHETRHWSTAYRGLVAIHAAKRWTEEERQICHRHGYNRMLRELLGISSAHSPVIYENLLTAFLPFGAIIAVGCLVDCVPTERCITFPDVLMEEWQHYIDPVDYAFGNYAPGRFAWEFRDIRILPEPIPYRGQQGLFLLDAAAVRSIGDA